MHVNHKRLLEKLSHRVAVGKNLNKQTLEKAESNEIWLDIYRSLDAERVKPRKKNRSTPTAVTKNEVNARQRLRSMRQRSLSIEHY
jgi:hypothetical protein